MHSLVHFSFTDKCKHHGRDPVFPKPRLHHDVSPVKKGYFVHVQLERAETAPKHFQYNLLVLVVRPTRLDEGMHVFSTEEVEQVDKDVVGAGMHIYL
jgi:hypothetical protein